MKSFATVAAVATALANLAVARPLARDAGAISSNLQGCLGATGAELSYPDSQSYANETAPENTAIGGFTPAVVAIPTDAGQVSSVVKCAVAENGGVKISPRSGGHGYAGYALGDNAQTVLMIDLKQLNQINVNAEAKTARIGAGQRLGGVAQTIGDQGFALPHGTCPQVGVAGHALGGGYGYPTRAWGYLMDHIVALELVDAQGNLRNITSADADLWFALRGAGSNNFGTVTAFEFALESAPTDVVNFVYTFPGNTDCAKALVVLQDLALGEGDSGLASSLGGELLVYGANSGSNNGACTFSGTFLGNLDGFGAEAGKLEGKLNAAGAQFQPSSTPFTGSTAWLDSLRNIMGSLGQTFVYEPYYAESLIDDGTVRYTEQSAQAIVDAVVAAQGVSGTGNSISFDLLGPQAKTNQVASDASAFPHRQAVFLSQIYSYGTPSIDNPSQRQPVLDALDGIVAATKAAAPNAAWGAYVNYIDPRLSDWAPAYYGANLDRLKALKASLDPTTLFDFPQGLARA